MPILTPEDMDILLLRIWARNIRFELEQLGRLRDEHYFASLRHRFPQSHQILSAYCGTVLLAKLRGAKVPKLKVGRHRF